MASWRCKILTCSEVIALIDVIITSILTGVIIWQSYRLHKNQNALEEKLNQSQLDMQKMLNKTQTEMQQRQLKLDVYEYRREIYLCLSKIFSFVDAFNSLLNAVDGSALNPSQYTFLLENIENEYIDSGSNLSERLLEAQHLFSDQIYKKINDVANKYNMIIKSIPIIKFHEKAEQYIDEDFANEIMNLSIKFIGEICEEKDSIIELLDKELDVSNLEK